MEMEKFIKKDNNGNNIPDENSFFSQEEKIHIRSGYSFKMLSVTQRFIDKLAEYQDIEQLVKFSLPLIFHVLVNGIVDVDTGEHIKWVGLEFNDNQWKLTTIEKNYPLDEYTLTWVEYKPEV